MKKALSLLLAIMLCFSMAGCAKEQHVSTEIRPEVGTIGPVFDKDVIYDNNGIKITALYLSSSYSWISVCFKIENNTNTPISIFASEKRINGESVGSGAFLLVLKAEAGETVIDDAFLQYSYIEEMGIYNYEDIFEIEFSLLIYTVNADETRNLIEETKIIKLKPVAGSTGIEEVIEKPSTVIINGNLITFTVPRIIISTTLDVSTYEYVSRMRKLGVFDIVQNMDDSVTITITREQQQMLLNELWGAVVEELKDDTLNNANIPFTHIEISEPYTGIMCYVDENDYEEHMYFYAAIIAPHCLHYQYWNGVESPSVTVIIVSGEPNNLGDILYMNVFSA